MKVELERSEKKTLLKGCLWMGENGGNSEGGEDEASQQLRLWQQQLFTAKTCDEEWFSKSYYL
jgi:hypothetical protein